jgi:ketosteroid isomerase-like protein
VAIHDVTILPNARIEGGREMSQANDVLKSMGQAYDGGSVAPADGAMTSFRLTVGWRRHRQADGHWSIAGQIWNRKP